MSEFGRLLRLIAGFVILIFATVLIPVWIHTGSAIAVGWTAAFLVACMIWGWVAAGLDYRNGKE
jgi:hypothetical protein